MMKIDRQDCTTIIRLLVWLVPAAALICLGHVVQGMVYAIGGMNISSMDSLPGIRNKAKAFFLALVLILLILALITLAVPFPWTQFLVLPGVCFVIAFMSVGGATGAMLGQLGLLSLLNCYLTLTVSHLNLPAWFTIAGWFFAGAFVTALIFVLKSLFQSERTVYTVFSETLALLAEFCRKKIDYLDGGGIVNMHSMYAFIRKLRLSRLEVAGFLEHSNDRQLKIVFVGCTRLADHLSALFVDNKSISTMKQVDKEFIRSALLVAEQFFLQQRKIFLLSKTELDENIVVDDNLAVGTLECEEAPCHDVLAMRAALAELTKIRNDWNSDQAGPAVKALRDPLLSQIKANFNWQSEILHYAIKLAVTALLALSVGWFLHLDRYYYIIMMALLMIKPTASGTWQMFRWRLLSTLIALLAVFLFLQLQPLPIIASFAVICSLGAARIYLRRNYLLFNLFLTFAISTFACAFMQTDVQWLTKLRVEDTFIGMFLALVVTLGIFPRWEIIYIKRDLANTWREHAQLIGLYLEKGGLDARDRKHSKHQLDKVYDSWRRMLDEPAGHRRNYSNFAKTIYATVMIDRLTFSLAVTDYRQGASSAAVRLFLEIIAKRLEVAAAIEAGETIAAGNQILRETTIDSSTLGVNCSQLDYYSQTIWYNICKYRLPVAN